MDDEGNAERSAIFRSHNPGREYGHSSIEEMLLTWTNIVVVIFTFQTSPGQRQPIFGVGKF